MNKIKIFFKSFIAVLIVCLGVYLFHFYLSTDFSLLSIGLGIIGFLLLYPGIKKWEEILFDSEDEKKL